MDRHDVNGTWQTGLVKQEAVHFLLSGRLGSLASPTGCCDHQGEWHSGKK